MAPVLQNMLMNLMLTQQQEPIMIKVLCILLLSSALILSLWAFWLAVRELMSE